MKTLLQYDLRIQQAVVLLFIGTLLTVIIMEPAFGFKLLLFEFFLMAVAQYTLNLLKFFRNNYYRTSSRKVYIFVSSYVVITFLFFILRRVLKLDFYSDFIDWMPLTWLLLSPILITLSVVISFYDRNEQEFKDNKKHS